MHGPLVISEEEIITGPTELSHGHPIYRVDTLYFFTVKQPSLHRDCYDRAPTTIALSQQCTIMEGPDAPPALRYSSPSPWFLRIVNMHSGMGASGSNGRLLRSRTRTFIYR